METYIKIIVIEEHSFFDDVLDIEEGGTMEEQKTLQRYAILIYIKSKRQSVNLSLSSYSIIYLLSFDE